MTEVRPDATACPLPRAAFYRPSFAVGREASDIVRERLRALKIGKEVKHGHDRGRVLLNKSHRSNLTAREAGETAGRGARRLGSLLARGARAVGRGAAAAAHGAAEFTRGAGAGVKSNSVAAPPKRRAKKGSSKKPAKKPAAKKAAPAAKKPAAKKKPMSKGVSKACAKKGIKIPEAKARQILKDGTIRGKPLSKEQRGLMGLVAGGCKTPKGAAARKRATKLDAERKAAKPTKKSTKAKKPAKAKPKAKKPSKPKTKAKAKAKQRRWKGSVKGRLKLTDSRPGRELATTKKPSAKKPKKKSRVPAASAVTAKAAPAKAKSGTRRKTQVAKKKNAGRKKAKAKKKNSGAVAVMNKPKKRKAKKANKSKAKKHNKKRKAKKKNQQQAHYYEGAVRVNGKKKSKNRKRNAGRRNSPEGTKKLREALGVATDSEIPNAIKRYVQSDASERRSRELNKKLETVLNKLTRSGYYDRPKATHVETLTDILRKVGLGAGHHRATTKKRKAKKTAPAASQVKKPAKKSKAKKHNRKKHHKAKKHNRKKAKGKGGKKKAKAKGGKKKAKAKAKKPAKKKAKAKKGASKKGKHGKKHHPALSGSLHGQIEMHEVRRNKKKRRNSGAVLVSNGMIGNVNDKVSGMLNSVPVAGSVLGPLWDNKSGVIGLSLGVVGSHALPQLVMPTFAASGWWQKLLSTALGGIVGVGVTALAAPFVAGLYTEEGRERDDEVKRQVAFASVGALGSLVSAAIIKATDPTSGLRVLNGTDAGSLADVIGLSDGPAPANGAPKLRIPTNGGPAGTGQPMCAPSDAPPQGPQGGDDWSSALDYGDAKFDPLGFEPDEYSDSSIMDFAAPAGMGEPWNGRPEKGTWNHMGDFAAPAMSDFAAPAMGDFAETAMGDDEMGDFAAPGLGDFAAPAM